MPRSSPVKVRAAAAARVPTTTGGIRTTVFPRRQPGTGHPAGSGCRDDSNVCARNHTRARAPSSVDDGEDVDRTTTTTTTTTTTSASGRLPMGSAEIDSRPPSYVVNLVSDDEAVDEDVEGDEDERGTDERGRFRGRDAGV